MKNMMKKEHFFNIRQQTVGAVERERERERDVILKPREKECGKSDSCGNVYNEQSKINEHIANCNYNEPNSSINLKTTSINSNAKNSTVQTKRKKIISRLLVAALLILVMSITTVFASSQTTLDKTPPEIKSILGEIKGSQVILHARATDNESKITGYAFTDTIDVPTTWNTVNSNSIYETYTVTTSGIYYFWVKNEDGAISNRSKLVSITATVPQYIVTYNANGGSNAPASQIKIEGEPLTLTENIPTRDGHTFLGWAETSGADTAIYQPGEIYEVNGDTILYAIWLPERYIITYDANGGNDAPVEQTVTYGKLSTLSLQEPTRENYNFLGWALEKSETTLRTSIANAPVLGEGMQAVYWSDENATDEYIVNSFSDEMYRYVILKAKPNIEPSYYAGSTWNTYSNVTLYAVWESTLDSKWANAKTTDDGSYWVWIPRYAYKITYYTDSNKTTVSETKTQYGDIDVLFMDGTSNTYYRDADGTQQTLPSEYKVHPAFQAMATEEDFTTNPLGKWDTELEGIWVAKYEASKETSTDGINWVAANVTDIDTGNVITTKAGNGNATQIRVVSKPSVNSWNYIHQTNIYINCENMYTELNTHQMKNSEWGAVAYLAYSPYGRNGEELAVNQCSSYYTGAGPGLGESTVYNGPYSYSPTIVKDSNGEIIAYPFDETYAWNTAQGKLASTTGNIYGIYDMAGGVSEHVASYVNNGHTNIIYGENMVNSNNIRNKQIYASTVSDGSDAYAADYNLLSPSNNNIYGDAVYETSISGGGTGSWCSDYSTFPGGYNLFITRGDYYYNGSAVGIFAFCINSGYSYYRNGFRPALCVTP